MGRDVRRVPLDFDWPMKKVWDGYLMPERLHEKDCPDCGGRGYSEEALRLQARWYGNAPFDPAETGSTPWTAETPEIRARAERNVEQAPGFYGYGSSEVAIAREAQRLADHFNSGWMHHLAQADVDVLIEGGRLHDFTHTWSPEGRWQPRDPSPDITAAEVNRWSVGFGFGHDAINCSIVVQAECERRGAPHLCSTCSGHGSTERWTGQRAEAEGWESIEPPTGEGWQMWETTSEGSPMSPVFATPEQLASWLADTGASMFGSEGATKQRWLSIITGDDFAHVEISPGVVMI